MALLGRILSPSCREMAPRWTKIAPRWPKIAPRWSKIAPRWPKIAQHSLQEEPKDPKKPSKVLYCRRFFGFRHFWQDRAQDPKQVAKMLPKVRQVGHLGLQVGHLGHILAPSWPTEQHLGPSWRHCAAHKTSKWSPRRVPNRILSHLGATGNRLGAPNHPWTSNFQRFDHRPQPD